MFLYDLHCVFSSVSDFSNKLSTSLNAQFYRIQNKLNKGNKGNKGNKEN